MSTETQIFRLVAHEGSYQVVITKNPDGVQATIIEGGGGELSGSDEVPLAIPYDSDRQQSASKAFQTAFDKLIANKGHLQLTRVEPNGDPELLKGTELEQILGNIYIGTLPIELTI